MGKTAADLKTLWIVSDQARNATGRVYKAFVASISSAAGKRRTLRVEYIEVELGALRHRNPKEASGFIARKIRQRRRYRKGGRHALLLIVDTESTGNVSVLQTAYQGIASQAAGLLGMRHHHCEILPPMTEAMYLVVQEIRQRIRDSATGKPASNHARLASLGHQRRNATQLPTKAAIESALADTNAFDKGAFAQQVEQCISGWEGLPPALAAMPCIQRLERWIQSL